MNIQAYTNYLKHFNIAKYFLRF